MKARLLISLLPLLAGCGSIYNSKFECPPSIGLRCHSVSQINDLVDRGKLKETIALTLPHRKMKKVSANHCIDCKQNEEPRARKERIASSILIRPPLEEEVSQ